MHYSSSLKVKEKTFFFIQVKEIKKCFRIVSSFFAIFHYFVLSQF